MHVFISGGCKNGKSYYAQSIAKTLAAKGKLYYIATMIPHDDEDRKRIKRHIREREGWGFTTIECPVKIENCIENADVNGCFLLDSVTALLANEMFHDDGGIDYEAGERVADEMLSFLSRTKNTVLVSDYIYSDAAVYDELTESYRRALAYIDRKLAQACECVIEVSAANAYYHKGNVIIQ